MKICILGDTHFGARNDSSCFSSHFKKFYDQIFFPYLEQNNILHVIQLGDVFDRRKYVNFQSLKDSHEFFFEKLNQEYTTWMLVGNHDTYYKNTVDTNSPRLLLQNYYNINVVDKPTEVEFEGMAALLIPWICADNEQQIMQSVKQTKAEIMFGHLELTGFEMYRGQTMDHGMDPKIFSKFELVMSGHYHHRSKGRNVVYTGTPYQMTWSDYDDKKGFHIYDTDTRTLEFVPNPFVMFHKLHYDDVGKDASYIDTFQFEDLEGCFVKLIVRNKTNPFWFDILVDRLEKIGVADLQVVEDHFHFDLEADEDIVDQAEDTMTILSKYLDQTDTGVDKKKLQTVLRELYDEALSLE